MTAKEKSYIEQLTVLGVYNPAFNGEIHQLCILERELSRARKEWKNTAPPDTAPSFTHELYAVIMQIQREILTRREALGLTPKALKRIKGAVALDCPAEAEEKTVFALISKQYAG